MHNFQDRLLWHTCRYVGYALTTVWEGSNAGDQQVIGFDMGGTSTDVSRYAGTYEHVFESTTAGARHVHFKAAFHVPPAAPFTMHASEMHAVKRTWLVPGAPAALSSVVGDFEDGPDTHAGTHEGGVQFCLRSNVLIDCCMQASRSRRRSWTSIP